MIVIRSLVPGGVAQTDGRLIPGDRLLGVNDVNVEHATLDVAVQVLKGAPKGVVRITVAKPLNANDAVSHASQVRIFTLLPIICTEKRIVTTASLVGGQIILT